MSHDYRPGDVLLLECPFTETAVTGVTRYYVSVRWPWLEVDPQAENIRWNGQESRPDELRNQSSRSIDPRTIQRRFAATALYCQFSWARHRGSGGGDMA